MHKYILSIANATITTTVQSTQFTKRRTQAKEISFGSYSWRSHILLLKSI